MLKYFLNNNIINMPDKCRAYLCEEQSYALLNGRDYCMKHIQLLLTTNTTKEILANKK